MNLGDIRTAAYNYLGMTETQNSVSPLEVNQYINEAQYEVFGKVALRHQSFFTTEANLSEVAGAKYINLPTNTYFLLRIDRVLSSAGAVGQLPYTVNRIRNNYRDRDQGRTWLAGQVMTPGPVERGYVQHGQKKIEMLPAPPASITDSLLAVYIYRPAEMADDSHVPFQETAGTGGVGLDNLVEFHDLLYLYAQSRMLQKEGALQESVAIKSDFAARLESLQTTLQAMNLQEPDYVSQGDQYEMFDFYE